MAMPPCSCGTQAINEQKTNSGQRRPKVTRRRRPLAEDSRVGHADTPGVMRILEMRGRSQTARQASHPPPAATSVMVMRHAADALLSISALAAQRRC
jgi:hypothetical protein